MSLSPAQRYDLAVHEMESTALDLLRHAERFSANIGTTQDRVNTSRALLQAARRYASSVRRLARLRA